MAYLTEADLRAFLDEDEMEALKRQTTTDNTDKIPVGITYAEAYVKDRIGQRYDMDVEYAKTGTARSTTLLEILAHIAIWKLAATFPTVQIDGKRHFMYEDAMANLTKIEKGQLLADLPAKDVAVGVPKWGTAQEFDVTF